MQLHNWGIPLLVTGNTDRLSHEFIWTVSRPSSKIDILPGQLIILSQTMLVCDANIQGDSPTDSSWLPGWLPPEPFEGLGAWPWIANEVQVKLLQPQAAIAAWLWHFVIQCNCSGHIYWSIHDNSECYDLSSPAGAILSKLQLHKWTCLLRCLPNVLSNNSMSRLTSQRCIVIFLTRNDASSRSVWLDPVQWESVMHTWMIYSRGSKISADFLEKTTHTQKRDLHRILLGSLWESPSTKWGIFLSSNHLIGIFQRRYLLRYMMWAINHYWLPMNHSSSLLPSGKFNLW